MSSYRIIKTRNVCCNAWTPFGINVGGDGYGIGVVIEPWGIRLRLIWWHICVLFPTEKKECGR